MSLKKFLALAARLVRWSRTICANAERRHHREHSCEVIRNLDQLLRRCRIKIFLFWSSGGPFVQQSGTICAIMIEGIMRNNSVILF